MEFNKYMFGSVAILALVLLQVSAFYFGFNGQVTTFCTTAIGAVLAFVFGYAFGKPPTERLIE